MTISQYMSLKLDLIWMENRPNHRIQWMFTNRRRAESVVAAEYARAHIFLFPFQTTSPIFQPGKLVGIYIYE